MLEAREWISLDDEFGECGSAPFVEGVESDEGKSADTHKKIEVVLDKVLNWLAVEIEHSSNKHVASTTPDGAGDSEPPIINLEDAGGDSGELEWKGGKGCNKYGPSVILVEK